MLRSKIKDIMKSKNLSWGKVLSQTKISKGTFARSLDSRIGGCSLNTLADIAGVLGVKVKDLFEED